MTVRELRESLADLPDDLEVRVEYEGVDAEASAVELGESFVCLWVDSPYFHHMSSAEFIWRRPREEWEE